MGQVGYLYRTRLLYGCMVARLALARGYSTLYNMGRSLQIMNICKFCHTDEILNHVDALCQKCTETFVAAGKNSNNPWWAYNE